MSAKKANLITHVGVVEHVSMPRVSVRILQASACSSCGAARLCHSAESQEKVIEAWVTDGVAPEIGQTVRLEGTVGQGMLATVLAYVVPLALMMAVLFALTLNGVSEGVAALAAVGCLVPWYGLLWLLRGRLTRRLTFTVKTEEN